MYACMYFTFMEENCVFIEIKKFENPYVEIDKRSSASCAPDTALETTTTVSILLQTFPSPEIVNLPNSGSLVNHVFLTPSLIL